jgi:hypothetical protein
MVGALFATLGLGGCSTTNEMLGRNQQTWTLATSDKIPAAQGEVKVSPQKDGNTKLKVEVQHLAPPTAVNEYASTYVVWLRPSAGLPQNVGVLKVNDKNKGELEAKTPFKTFDVMVTAEQNATATVPSGDRVLTASVVVPT